ncbi:MAG TPA: SPASM domain-containing protein [Blastocatellia bacterium]|nr:SPASM domain-containing protein [Blastocatellia bacterium]
MIDRGWDGERFERIVHNIKALPIRMNIRLRVPGEISTNKLLMAGAKSLADSPNVHSINLLTNLSLRKDQFERLFQGFDDSKVAIVGSYHPTEVKNPDQWIETALYANDRFDFAICLVAWPPLLADLSERKRDLESKGFTVFVQAFIGDYEDRPYPGSYTDTERAALKPLFYSRHDYEFLLNLKQPDLCNAGYRSFYIAEDGEVFPCGNGAWEFSMGNLSNSPEIKLGDGARPCPFQTCQCDTENMNTQVFHQNYTLTGINQHKYTYRLKAKAKTDPAVDEWAINY